MGFPLVIKAFATIYRLLSVVNFSGERRFPGHQGKPILYMVFPLVIKASAAVYHLLCIVDSSLETKSSMWEWEELFTQRARD